MSDVPTESSPESILTELQPLITQFVQLDLADRRDPVSGKLIAANPAGVVLEMKRGLLAVRPEIVQAVVPLHRQPEHATESIRQQLTRAADPDDLDPDRLDTDHLYSEDLRPDDLDSDYLDPDDLNSADLDPNDLRPDVPVIAYPRPDLPASDDPATLEPPSFPLPASRPIPPASPPAPMAGGEEDRFESPSVHRFPRLYHPTPSSIQPFPRHRST